MLDMVHCVSKAGVVQFSDDRLDEVKSETLKMMIRWGNSFIIMSMVGLFQTNLMVPIV